jgi:hypothetical protein
MYALYILTKKPNLFRVRNSVLNYNAKLRDTRTVHQTVELTRKDDDDNS